MSRKLLWLILRIVLFRDTRRSICSKSNWFDFQQRLCVNEKFDKEASLHEQIFLYRLYLLSFHRPCEHISEDYVTDLVKNSLTKFLEQFSLLCVNSNSLQKFL